MIDSSVASSPSLRVRGLTKRYGTTVLDRVSIDFWPGEIHALVGANGAGKSTLCKIIAGQVPASAGEMELGAIPYAPTGKAAAESAGVQIVQQELNLISTLSVAENLCLRDLPSRWGVVDRRALHRRAAAALARMGLERMPPETVVGELGIGQQQLVEIAAALDRDSHVLILDEPTAALAPTEAERLFEQLRELRRSGLAILYISHRLDEIAAIADRVSVLRDGKLVVTEPIGRLDQDSMVRLMSGEVSVGKGVEPISYARAPIALRVQDLSRPPQVQGVSFEVAAGERLGIAGLVGSGRTELLRAIFGADVAERGAVFVGEDPTPYRFSQPRQAVAHGLAMVTEDRKENGLLLGQSIRDNTVLGTLARFAGRCGLPRRTAEVAETNRLVAEMDIRCRDIEQSVGQLSGGNQQKVAIAKWLARGPFARTRQRSPQVYLFDEPTRGIDIAARQHIYRLFDSLAAAGAAVVIVSSDLDELMRCCDAIGVISAGRWVERYPRATWDRTQILAACFQGQQNSGGSK